MSAPTAILFLCPHGGAKSVIAASYFNRIAEQIGLDYVGIAAAAEEPYAAVPPGVADFLERDGFDVRTFTPRRAEADDFTAATRIVDIGCEDAALARSDVGAERWDDVPLVSEDLPGSAAAIRRHVEALAEELRGGR